ncbi:hypothetical protein, partial [Bacillus subtilis]|uniref:hypothetical protein n=1 Tax=Bacillus subtilis TaxID=1423 RepID=UPI001BDB9FA5
EKKRCNNKNIYKKKTTPLLLNPAPPLIHQHLSPLSPQLQLTNTQHHTKNIPFSQSSYLNLLLSSLSTLLQQKITPH